MTDSATSERACQSARADPDGTPSAPGLMIAASPAWNCFFGFHTSPALTFSANTSLTPPKAGVFDATFRCSLLPADQTSFACWNRFASTASAASSQGTPRDGDAGRAEAGRRLGFGGVSYPAIGTLRCAGGRHAGDWFRAD